LQTALIIGTRAAVDVHSNGASLRLKYLSSYLSSKNYLVTITSLENARLQLVKDFDLIVISSYSAARIGQCAREHTNVLWFDPYDSWTKSRISFIQRGHIRQIAALARDFFFTLKFPQREITSFISEEDANFHTRFLRHDNLFILPTHFEPMPVTRSNKIRLVFHGDGGYKPNQEALFSLNKIGSALGMTVQVVGKGYKNQERFPYCDFHGYVPEQYLYQSLDIHLAPLNSGAGIKTKVALPLSLGLRVVANPESSIGLLPNQNLIIGKNLQELIALISKEISREWTYLGVVDKIYSQDDWVALGEIL
jgi:hypothetical protein